MSSKLNIREIARLAGVSVASVSRALQPEPSPYLSSKKRAEILEVCARYRYYPNEHARRMLTRKSETIALFFPRFAEISADFSMRKLDDNFSSCLLGAQSFLTSAGFSLLLTELNGQFLSSKDYLRMCRSKLLDGILVWGALDKDKYLQELVKEKIPLVLLQNSIDGLAASSVTATDYSGSAASIERLLDFGHKRIAFAPPPQGSSTGRARYSGVKDTLLKHGINDFIELSSSGYGYNFGLQVVKELKDKLSEITAIILPNDLAAWGCIDALKSLSIRVPENISIVGADGIWVPGDIQISSYKTPAYEIGENGAQILLDEINDEKDKQHLVLPVELIKGNTIKKV